MTYTEPKTKEERITFKKGLMRMHASKALESLDISKRATAVGSGRKVYNVKNVEGMLVKKAINMCGVEQVYTEVSIYNSVMEGNAFEEVKALLPIIFNGAVEYEGGKDYSGCFLIMQKLKPLPYEEGKVNILSVCSEYGVPPMQLNMAIRLFAKQYKLHIDDIWDASQWGLTPKGKLKLMDWGTTNEIYAKYYYD